MRKRINPTDGHPHFLFMTISNFSFSTALTGSQLPHSLVTVMVYDLNFYSLILPVKFENLLVPPYNTIL
jgi:hypothetical protein